MARGAIAAGSMADGSARLRSPLAGVADAAWSRFVGALTIQDDPGPGAGAPRAFDALSAAGGFGCFDLRPRRLADLGIMRAIRPGKGGRAARGEWAPPWDRAKFCAPLAQYGALVESLRRFDRALAGVARPPGMSRSGALALFHRLGPLAMAKWAGHRQAETAALYARANGLF